MITKDQSNRNFVLNDGSFAARSFMRLVAAKTGIKPKGIKGLYYCLHEPDGWPLLIIRSPDTLDPKKDRVTPAESVINQSIIKSIDIKEN